MTDMEEFAPDYATIDFWWEVPDCANCLVEFPPLVRKPECSLLLGTHVVIDMSDEPALSPS